ncbi:hypothetical protein NFI96_023870 [Prochilodus magdalenae]|nr:hypothetical protein NFI96_023870 [Prochilodus magdalenae]
MALLSTDLHHPLYYWCLPQAAIYIPSVKNLVRSANMTRKDKTMPLSPYTGMPILTMLEKVGLHMWEVIWKVIRRFMHFTELLNSKVFLVCAGDTVAMEGESKKKTVGLKALEGPGGEARNTESGPATMYKMLDPQRKIMEGPDRLAVDGDEVVLSDWLEWESEEEEEDGNSISDEGELDDADEDKEESPMDEKDEMDWSDEDDSDWSDEEGDSEASRESTELWESFLNNSDPYNPLYFFCPTGVKAKSTDTTQNSTASRPPGTNVEESPAAYVEEHSSGERTKEGTKKVRFSEEVTVHHLVAWSFACREARDGSCWMELARDRERFRRRVERTGEVLSPCLTEQHRARVWDRLQRGVQPERF